MDCVAFPMVDDIVKLSIPLVSEIGVIAGVASSGIIEVSANNV